MNKKLKDLDSKPVSKWVVESDLRLKNLERPRYSQLVAIRILRTLREKKMTQKDLADILVVTPQTVNKWVKGSENFTFDTIERLELALEIKLMHIYNSHESFKGKVVSKIIGSKVLKAEQQVSFKINSVASVKKETKVIPLNAYYINEATTPKLNYKNS